MGKECTEERTTLQLRLGLFLLSAALLVFEINLTRLFSVTQFYHFAFMVVSIALLGYGASGTLLGLLPRLSRLDPGRSLSWLSLASALTILGAYLLTNQLPFDSFSIAWDRKQVANLGFHYVSLALPFLFGGMAVSQQLSAYPRQTGQVYSVNLLGSAFGCLFALWAPSTDLGGEGTVILSSCMAALAAFTAGFKRSSSQYLPISKANRTARILLNILIGLLLIFSSIDLGRRILGKQSFDWLDLNISPYKSLSYALQVPGAELIFQRWNAFSRIDLVSSPGIHSFPGLSYRYLKPLPSAQAVLVDADDLSPIVESGDDLEFTDYLPAAVAYQLRPNADTLVLEPRGGLDLLTALAHKASHVTAVEINPLIVSAVGGIYSDPRLTVAIESSRSYLRKTSHQFDVVVISLTNTYHPVRSGAYSLGEDYLYTVESFRDAIGHLNTDGLLVLARWLQDPPSESLRTFAMLVTALEQSHGDPRTQIIALRSYNTAFFLVKNSPFTQNEIQIVRSFAGSRAFDFTYAPGVHPDEVNQYNILPDPIYFEAFRTLLETTPRSVFYATYPFDVTPATDDHPFFAHYFKWSQAKQILAEFGKTWQPFGGAGYFVIIALLALALMMSMVLIVLPVVVIHLWKRSVWAAASAEKLPGSVHMIYFGLIGLAFILVEIPLIQWFVLYLGHPAYAMTTVLFSLLFFSGLGSRYGQLPVQVAIGFLTVLLLVCAWILPLLFHQTLGLPLIYRVFISMAVIAPLGFLMGIPFPGGLRWMLARGEYPNRIAWIWAVNGTASVVSSVLAALLALSFGFTWVLYSGAIFYTAAWVAIRAGSGRALA